jgi:uncharacterized protein YjiS (DUF1127 family)
MLCGTAPRSIIEQLQQRFSSHLEPSMSILLSDASSIPPPRTADPAVELHQSGSGPSTAIRRPVWWSWLDRPFQRMALRDIADDPHLLRDIGLTREEALGEAEKPFWR